MKIASCPHTVTFDIIEGVTFDKYELAFLREMARHCIETRMAGAGACSRLDALLAKAGVESGVEGPVYGLFEEHPEDA